MPAAVVLLVVLASSAAVGMILPEGAARAYVFGRAWFYVLLGLFGVSLAGCMLRRIRSGSMTVWSFLTHGGVLLLLGGACVTLIWAERGAVVIREGQTVDSFEKGTDPEERAPLGFAVRLLDFRIEHYPPVDYLFLLWPDRKTLRIKLDQGGEVRIPRTGVLLRNIRFVPGPGDGMVEVLFADGTKAAVPVTVGASHELDRAGRAVRILRYEPSFKMDIETKEVTSDSDKPRNPAIQVQLVRGGKAEAPRWLFARMPGFRHLPSGEEAGPPGVEMRFLHPACPVFEAQAVTDSGLKKVQVVEGSFVRSPWDPTALLGYERESRVKEYESAVEILEDGKVVKRHVIRVNDPLRHGGTALYQLDYDRDGLRWSALGVSRDRGAGFVYAGFLTMSLGLAGKFYLRAMLDKVRRPRGEEGGVGGAS